MASAIARVLCVLQALVPVGVAYQGVNPPATVAGSHHGICSFNARRSAGPGALAY
jgi:hypothetical protein